MFLRKKLAVSADQEIMQEEDTVQEDTDSGVAAELQEGIRSERSGSRHYRRPHRHTASDSVREHRGPAVAGEHESKTFARPRFDVCSRISENTGEKSTLFWIFRCTQYGLYSSFMACFIYTILGSCKDVPVGPTAIIAILTRETLQRANLGPDFAVLLAFVSGCISLLMGILQLGNNTCETRNRHSRLISGLFITSADVIILCV